jgi:hypothetical protein
MNNWIVIQNELSALNSSLPAEKIGEAYTVPEGYFDKFVSSVLERIQLEGTSPKDELSHLSPFLSRISKKMPFSVPDDYFAQAVEEIPALVNDDPLLPGVSKSIPYQIPANYFEELPARLISLAKTPQTDNKKTSGAKVIAFGPARWVRFAAAAILVGVLALGSVLYLNTRNASEGGNPEEWLANKLKNVSNQDLEEFIKATDISFTVVARSEKAKKPEVRKLLNDVPDSELQKFLEEIPAENEDLLMFN